MQFMKELYSSKIKVNFSSSSYRTSETVKLIFCVLCTSMQSTQMTTAVQPGENTLKYSDEWGVANFF